MTHQQGVIAGTLWGRTADLLAESEAGPWQAPWQWWVVCEELANELARLSPYYVRRVRRYTFDQAGEPAWVVHQDTIRALRAALPDYISVQVTGRLCGYCMDGLYKSDKVS